MAGWIFAGIYLLILFAIQRQWDRNVPRNWRYDPVRKWRSSRMALFLKAWLILIPPILVVTLIIGGTILNALVGSFFGLLAFVAFMEIGSRAFLGWWHADNPSYAALLRDGWDPFWDTWLLGLVNRDPDEVKAGMPPLGLNPQNFTPPSNWTIRCPACGAAQPSPIFWCWNCRRGYENGCQKLCCPTCDTTFCESQPGVGRTMAVTCPGCKTAWNMP